jgi:hypothetical protein
MAGRSGVFGSAIVLVLVGSGCGYDRGATPTGPGYGDGTVAEPPARPAMPVAAVRPTCGCPIRSSRCGLCMRGYGRNPDGVFHMTNARVP